MKSHIKITKNIFVLALVLAATGCDDSAKENSNSYSRNDNSQSSAEISSSEPVSSSSVSYSAVIGSGSGITYTDTPSSPGQIDPSTPSSANPSEHLTVKTITSKLYYKYKEKKMMTVMMYPMPTRLLVKTHFKFHIRLVNKTKF